MRPQPKGCLRNWGHGCHDWNVHCGAGAERGRGEGARAAWSACIFFLPSSCSPLTLRMRVEATYTTLHSSGSSVPARILARFRRESSAVQSSSPGAGACSTHSHSHSHSHSHGQGQGQGLAS